MYLLLHAEHKACLYKKGKEMENCSQEEGQGSSLGIRGFREGSWWELAWLQQGACSNEQGR